MAVRQKTEVEKTENILEEREKTHGSFTMNAKIFQNLLLEMTYREENPAIAPEYTPVQSLALMQILLKLSRIKQNPKEIDHWKDIAGYAQLVVKDMEF